LLYLVANFGRQVAVSYQQGQELAQIQEKVRLAEEQNQQLHDYQGYVNSASAVEAWRENRVGPRLARFQSSSSPSSR